MLKLFQGFAKLTKFDTTISSTKTTKKYCGHLATASFKLVDSKNMQEESEIPFTKERDLIHGYA